MSAIAQNEKSRKQYDENLAINKGMWDKTIVFDLLWGQYKCF